MLGLDQLKRFMQRHYGGVATGAFLFALLTFLLELNYVKHQRDLLFWREVVLLVRCRPGVLCVMVVAMTCQGLALALMQRRFLEIIVSTILHLMDEYRVSRYADFLVRRLLLQLDAVTVHVPRQLPAHQIIDPITSRRCQLVNDVAHDVVAVFRRDAAELLSGDNGVCVPHEEEQILQCNGYGSIELSVDVELLRTLLSPPSQAA